MAENTWVSLRHIKFLVFLCLNGSSEEKKVHFKRMKERLCTSLCKRILAQIMFAIHMLRESCKPIKGHFNELFHNLKLKPTNQSSV